MLRTRVLIYTILHAQDKGFDIHDITCICSGQGFWHAGYYMLMARVLASWVHMLRTSVVICRILYAYDKGFGKLGTYA